MLKRLSIKNVALIERLDMDFDNGLNVLIRRDRSR